MLRGLSFSFPTYVGIIFCLAILAVGLDNELFSLVYTEERHKQSVFIKELENLVKNFEYTFDIEGKQIFPTNNIKQDIVSEYKSSEYNISPRWSAELI